MSSRAYPIRRSVDKVKCLIFNKKHLALPADKAPEKPSRLSHSRPVKLPRMPIRKSCDFSVKKKILPGQRPLIEKTQLIRKNSDSPLAAKALRASRLCAEEQQMQSLLLRLRDKDCTRFLPGRCTPLRFKELQLAQKNLKNMKRTPLHNRSRSFTDLSASEKDAKDKSHSKEMEKWEELTRLKEERQFRISRVLEYLTK